MSAIVSFTRKTSYIAKINHYFQEKVVKLEMFDLYLSGVPECTGSLEGSVVWWSTCWVNGGIVDEI